MKIYAEYIFDADLERTIEICVHNIMGNVEYFKAEYENVADVELIERIDHPDGKIHVKLDFCAHGHIPRVVQHLLKPKMLTWREISTWDPATRRYNYQIKTYYFTKVFNCRGYWAYEEIEPGKTSQKCIGTLNIRIPVFGPLIEKEIRKNLKKNWDKATARLKKKHGV